MGKGLCNKLLGIISLDSILSLKAISEGVGRRSLVTALKEELKLSSSGENRLNNMVDKLFSDEESLLNSEISTERYDIETTAEEVKGVVFILENIKKMKKAQRILQAVELNRLYKKVASQKTAKGQQSFKMAKGVLVNKRQY